MVSTFESRCDQPTHAMGMCASGTDADRPVADVDGREVNAAGSRRSAFDMGGGLGLARPAQDVHSMERLATGGLRRSYKSILSAPLSQCRLLGRLLEMVPRIELPEPF